MNYQQHWTINARWEIIGEQNHWPFFINGALDCGTYEKFLNHLILSTPLEDFSLQRRQSVYSFIMIDVQFMIRKMHDKY